MWLCDLYHGALGVLKSSRALCHCFSICFSILITSFGEEGAGLCFSRAFVCLFCACMFLSFFSSSWCRGLAAVCDCGIPWTFLLIFFILAKAGIFDFDRFGTLYTLGTCPAQAVCGSKTGIIAAAVAGWIIAAIAVLTVVFLCLPCRRKTKGVCF